MKYVAFLLSFILGIFCVSYALAGEFVDDFKNPAKTKAMWETVYREWIIQDGCYYSPGKDAGTEDPIALLNIQVGDGMVIEAQCADQGDGTYKNFAIVYAYESKDVAWAAGAGIGNTSWRMFQFTPSASKGGAWGSDFVAIVTSKTPLAVNIWYNIRVEIKGNDITLLGSSTPDSNKLDEGNKCTLSEKPKGRIGLGGAGSSPKLKYFKVTGPSVPNLSVIPAGKLACKWGEIKRY